MEAKRERSNLRRLESLKAKKLGRNIQVEQIKASLKNLDSKVGAVLNKKIVFHSDDDDDDDKVCPKDEHAKRETTVGSAMLPLFPSNSEDDDDNIDQFQIRSQIQGPDGPQFLEENCDPRFQLNNMFIEESGIEEQAVESSDEKNEKQKNMEILESVLGFQLPKIDKEPSGAKKKKKYVHFNPEDEDSWKYLRKVEPKEEDKTVGKEATSTSEPQVSPKRYFEVSADLKSALRGADGEFRLSKMFESSNGLHEINDEEFSISNTLQKNRPPVDDPSNTKSKKTTVRNVESLSLPSTEINENEHHPKFFIMPGDERLTEGIEFFRRKKSMEEIREDFFKTREFVLEILKKRHRRGLKSPYVAKNKR